MPPTNKKDQTIKAANREAEILQRCINAVLRLELQFNNPKTFYDLDPVTTVAYYALQFDAAHGGIVAAVRTVQQPDNQPATVSFQARYLDDLREDYRAGRMNSQGAQHFEELMRKTGATL